jgi:uncharacterized protein
MKTMAKLVVNVSFKADADPASRTFEGLASTWDQDLGNDVIKRGAFKDTLAEWKGGSDAIPLLNSHDHWNIFSSIGQLVEAKETKDGLWTKWEVLDGPEGDQVLSRIRPSKTTGRPIVGKMSIGYEPQEFSFEQPPGTESFWDRLRILTKVALKEVSLVLFPMNPGAAIDPTTVKTFMEAVQETDPTKMSAQTKAQFRKLASRIGILLKKDKTPTPPADDAEDEDDELEAPPAPVTPPDDGDDDDSTDDAIEDVLGDVEEKDKKEKEKEQKDDAPQPYVYQEALAQRLLALNLKNKVSEIVADD